MEAALVSFKSEKKTVWETKYLPGVIEPSFGIGRILYAVLEHAFTQRDGDENRCVMRLRPCVAPIKVGIFRLLNNPEFDIVVQEIQETFQYAKITNRVDSTSGTVGRRYARADELGIPFGITVDFQSLLDDCVTLRERDSMVQIRIPISKLLLVVRQLIDESVSWSTMMSRYPIVVVKDDDEGGCKVELENNSISRQVTTRGSFSRPKKA